MFVFNETVASNVTFVLVAIIVGALFELYVFRSSTPIAAIPALFAGYLASRTVEYCFPFILWVKSGGLVQILVLAVGFILTCIMLWLLWLIIGWLPPPANINPSRPQPAANTSTINQQPRFPGLLYHASPDINAVNDIFYNHRFKVKRHSNIPGFYLSEDLDHVLSQYGKGRGGAVVKRTKYDESAGKGDGVEIMRFFQIYYLLWI